MERAEKGRKRTGSVSGSWNQAYAKFNWKLRSRRDEWQEKEWLTAKDLLEKAQQMLQHPLVPTVSKDGELRIDAARWSLRDASTFIEATHPQLVKSADSNFDIKTDIEVIPTNTNTKHLEEKLSKLN